MADKMNEKNEKNEKDLNAIGAAPVTGTDKQEVNAAPVTGSVADDFVKLENEEFGETPTSRSDVVPIGVMMQRMERGRSASGRIYYNYVLGVRSQISENEFRTNKVHFKLRKEYEEAYEYLDIAFRNGDMAPVSIRRTEMTDRSGHRTVTYSAEVSYKDFDGVECAIPMVPSNDNDRAQFGYMINRLKFRGILR